MVLNKLVLKLNILKKMVLYHYYVGEKMLMKKMKYQLMVTYQVNILELYGLIINVIGE